MTEIHPLQEDITKQYVHNRPFEGVRSNYGNKALSGLVIDKIDNDIIERIKKREATKSRKAKLRYK